MTVLHVLSAGAAKGLVLGMQEPFSAASGVSVEGAFGAVGAMREKFLAREPCDLIILTAAIIDALAAQGLVHADSVAALGRVHTGIAVPAGDAHPAIADADGLRRALEVARGIYLPDPERATAGIHFAKRVARAGDFRPGPGAVAALSERRGGDARNGRCGGAGIDRVHTGHRDQLHGRRRTRGSAAARI
ncbi:MAG: substrate-binding domain-containing protein [Betaproteobacteria bacterium]|nr:substrate-binding domain-containing protein [Betaproteobacteria bacterium]